MMEFISAALSFPSVIFTVLMGFVALFWSSVIFGGMDPNALDGADAGDADADVDVDAGDADHGDAGDADHGDADHGDGHGVPLISSLLSFLNVGSVPISVVVSAMVIFGWAGTMLLQLKAGPMLATLMPATLAGIAIFGTATAAGMVATRYATRPMRGMFKIESKHAEETIVDCVCTVLTSHVSGDFGQASYETTGAPLTLSVRSKVPNKLSKGAKAVIIGYDALSNTYEVGELEPELPTRRESGRTDSRKSARVKEIREALRKAGAK